MCLLQFQQIPHSAQHIFVIHQVIGVNLMVESFPWTVVLLVVNVHCESDYSQPLARAAVKT
jgi:hypothetical protein